MRPVSEITLSARRGLRIKEAADYIGSTPWFIEVAIRQRRIPAHKLGRHYVLFKDDLDNYIERVRMGGAV
jgi:excisionase family DNA binding protein